jgi:hypothetical protein
MRVVAAVGLGVLFALGAVVGIALGAIAFVVSVIRGARAVHAEGVVCRAEVIGGADALGARLAGAAVVRLSGAFAGPATTGADVLGLELRLRAPADATSDALSRGDQDLVFGTFESFWTAAHDRAATNAGDYLANRYSTVTPWWLRGEGAKVLRLRPVGAPIAGADRSGRLDAAIAADRARLTLHRDHDDAVVAELRLIERLDVADRGLRASMFRAGRGVRAVGFRNGLRATIYPLSQAGRAVRGR